MSPLREILETTTLPVNVLMQSGKRGLSRIGDPQWVSEAVSQMPSPWS